MENIKVETHIINKELTEMVPQEISIKCLGLKGNDNLGVDMVYSYKIPDHIYDALVDTSEQYRSHAKMKEDREKARKRGDGFSMLNDKYFSKNIQSILISDIVTQIMELSHAILVIKQNEKAPKVKKIFIHFKGGSKKTRSEMYGAFTGELTVTEFQYFMGYESEAKVGLFNDKTQKQYATDIVMHSGSTINKGSHESIETIERTDKYSIYRTTGHTRFYGNDTRCSREGFLNRYVIIDWSQEREEFLESLQERFKNLNEELNKYLKDLNGENLDRLIANNQLLLK